MKALFVISGIVALTWCTELDAQTGQPVSASRDAVVNQAAAVTDSTQASGAGISGDKASAPSSSAENNSTQAAASPGAQPADDKKKPKQ